MRSDMIHKIMAIRSNTPMMDMIIIWAFMIFGSK